MVALQSGKHCGHWEELVVSKILVKLAASQGLHMVEFSSLGRYQGVQPSDSAAIVRAHSKRQVGWEYSE